MLSIAINSLEFKTVIIYVLLSSVEDSYQQILIELVTRKIPMKPEPQNSNILSDIHSDYKTRLASMHKLAYCY